jgi:hypothetical protein
MQGNAGSLIVVLLLAGCVSRASRDADDQCIKAIELNELKVIPQHYLPYQKGSAYEVTGAPDNSYSHYGKGKYAWDIASSQSGRGVPLLASVDGCIRALRRNATARYGGQESANNVNYIVLEWRQDLADQYRRGAKIESLYLHLESLEPSLYPGKCVKRGEKLGVTGCTGWCSGIHLHYQVQERPSNYSWWGQSVPIGFAERVQPRKGVLARSQNPAVASSPSTNPVTQPNPSPRPQPEPVPPVVPATPVEQKPDSTPATPLDIEFLCNSLDVSRAWCARRIPGFAQRQELVNCGKGWVEVCVNGCLFGDASDSCKSEASGSPTNDPAVGSKTPEESPAKTEPGQAPKTGENGDGTLDNSDQIPAAELDEDLGRNSSECY